MSKLEESIKNYLEKAKFMQLATSVNVQPWACILGYAFDEQLNLYWISKTDTRHSEEIEQNPKVAGSIISEQLQPERGVKGLQFEGNARLLDGEEEANAIELYRIRMNREATLLEDIRSGKNPHKVYKVTPSRFVLFDSTNAPGEEREELKLS